MEFDACFIFGFMGSMKKELEDNELKRNVNEKETRLHTYQNGQIQTLTTSNAGNEMEQQELSFIAGGKTKWYSHFGRQFCSFLQS